MRKHNYSEGQQRQYDCKKLLYKNNDRGRHLMVTSRSTHAPAYECMYTYTHAHTGGHTSTYTYIHIHMHSPHTHSRAYAYTFKHTPK